MTTSDATQRKAFLSTLIHARHRRPSFAGARFRDAQGQVWQEIDLAALAQQDQFLAIAA